MSDEHAVNDIAWYFEPREEGLEPIEFPYCTTCGEEVYLEDDGAEPTPEGMAEGEYWKHVAQLG